MSKLSLSIIDALQDGKWVTNVEIARRIKGNANSVRLALQRLQEAGAIVKCDDPGRPAGALYKIGRVPMGFGISRNMFEFQRLLQAVRL